MCLKKLKVTLNPVNYIRLGEDVIFMSNDEKRYIQKTRNGKKYTVSKKVGNETVYFGTYDSLRDAKFARDYFEKHEWSTIKRDELFNLLPEESRGRLGKHIHTDGAKYHIQKHINRKLVYFGRYPTLEDAIIARQYFEEHDWNPEDVSKWNMAKPYKNNHRFIVKNNTGYQLKKTINGANTYFGSYDTLDEALAAREYFEKHDWDIKDRFKFTKPRKQPAEIDLNKPYFESMRLV